MSFRKQHIDNGARTGGLSVSFCALSGLTGLLYTLKNLVTCLSDYVGLAID